MASASARTWLRDVVFSSSVSYQDMTHRLRIAVNSDLLLPIVRGQYFAVTDTDRKSGRAACNLRISQSPT